MGVLSESWCFCKGLGKSERLKAAIFSTKAPAMARVSGSGTGFLIHRNLLLTTHTNLPSVAAAEGSEIRLQNDVAATLVPHRFFISSSVLDLTIVGLDTIDGDSASQVHPHYLKTCSKPSLDLGCGIFLLGHTDKKDLSISEGKVVIATDNLIKLSTDGVTLSPGSAGFDMQGNLAFMICDPMKLATSPNTKSSSTSSSTTTSKKDFDFPMQFGIPIPIIIDWLNQHWEGSLDEVLNKPRLPIMRLMSSGQKSEHSCASFTLRQVFKSAGDGNDGTVTPSSSNRAQEQDFPETFYAAAAQGIHTPEIYESPKLIPVPTQKKESPQVQLLDINFPPLITKPLVHPPKRDQPKDKDSTEIASTGSVTGAQSQCQSSSSPIEVSEMQSRYSSEGETMYSAETAESRNYTTPREGKLQSKSCANMVARRASLESQRSFVHGRNVQSMGATSQRSNDYYSPTVSSIMKKRINVEQGPRRARQSSVHTSPRWNF